jgi:hypothetical protein
MCVAHRSASANGSLPGSARHRQPPDNRNIIAKHQPQSDEHQRQRWEHVAEGMDITTMKAINPIAAAVLDRLSTDARWLSLVLAKLPAAQ